MSKHLDSSVDVSWRKKCALRRVLRILGFTIMICLSLLYVLFFYGFLPIEVLATVPIIYKIGIVLFFLIFPLFEMLGGLTGYHAIRRSRKLRASESSREDTAK